MGVITILPEIKDKCKCKNKCKKKC